MRDHVSELQDERRTAQRLLESVRRTRDLGDPNQAAKYAHILNMAQDLADYYARMAKVFDEASYNTDTLLRWIRSILEEDADRVRYASSQIKI